jgi:hypothetical protein
LDRGYGKPLATATVQETAKIEVIHRVIVDPDPKVIEHDELEAAALKRFARGVAIGAKADGGVAA